MGGPASNAPNPPWWVKVLEEIEAFIKRNWSGLAVLLYDYEEQKVDAAKQSEKAAELKEKLVEDENNVLKSDANKSDDDVIREQLGLSDDDSKS